MRFSEPAMYWQVEYAKMNKFCIFDIQKDAVCLMKFNRLKEEHYFDEIAHENVVTKSQYN